MRALGAGTLALLGMGCSVGPDYTAPPSTLTPASYKEAGNWKPAHPHDDMVRGKWWQIYHEPDLNALEEQVNISNQNVIQAEAQFREAAAAVKVSRAAFFPTLTANPSYTASESSQTLTSGSSHGSGGGGGGAVLNQLYDVPAQASYLVDVWGAVRRSVEMNSATAQATFADLENARLSYQATLAQDYFSLRGLDAQKELLEQTVQAYQKSLDLTTNRYKAGVSAKGDVLLAQTQLDTAKTQLIDLGVQRAQYEHAIATLTGKPAPIFSMRQHPLTATPPRVPAGVPSSLLERRPDIAGAERRVASANASIGVQVAAYYPSLTLTGTAGLESIQLSQLFSGPSFFWSVGPALAQTVFDAGRTHGQVQEAQATYDATVASYRETVLTAFQQVEDSLSGLRILEEEAGVANEAVTSAKQSVDIAANQYKAGTQDYLLVITNQTLALNDEVTALNIRTRRMTTSVLLIEALGGGWDVSQLPGKPGVADVPEAQDQIAKEKK